MLVLSLSFPSLSLSLTHTLTLSFSLSQSLYLSPISLNLSTLICLSPFFLCSRFYTALAASAAPATAAPATAAPAAAPLAAASRRVCSFDKCPGGKGRGSLAKCVTCLRQWHERCAPVLSTEASSTGNQCIDCRRDAEHASRRRGEEGWFSRDTFSCRCGADAVRAIAHSPLPPLGSRDCPLAAAAPGLPPFESSSPDGPLKLQSIFSSSVPASTPSESRARKQSALGALRARGAAYFTADLVDVYGELELFDYKRDREADRLETLRDRDAAVFEDTRVRNRLGEFGPLEVVKVRVSCTELARHRRYC
jgi:hypothetical protein